MQYLVHEYGDRRDCVIHNLDHLAPSERAKISFLMIAYGTCTFNSLHAGSLKLGFYIMHQQRGSLKLGYADYQNINNWRASEASEPLSYHVN